MASTNVRITTILQMNNRGFRKGLTGSQKALQGFRKQVEGIGKMIAGAFAVTTIVRFGQEALRLAMTMQGVEMAFKRIGDQKLLNELREATAGTVSNLELMRRTVMSHNFQIPLKDLASLFEFATKRAQETGESVDYLVNSIVIGIGRKSPLILDNLGISAVSLRQKLDNVGHSGATVGQVAAAVGEIARESMKEMGDVAETAAVQFERLKAQFKDFLAEAGEKALKLWADQRDYLDDIAVILDTQTLPALKRMSAFFGIMSEDDVAKLAKSIKDAAKDAERDLMSDPIDVTNLFGGQQEMTKKFKQSFLWGMTMAIADMEDKEPRPHPWIGPPSHQAYPYIEKRDEIYKRAGQHFADKANSGIGWTSYLWQDDTEEIVEENVDAIIEEFVRLEKAAKSLEEQLERSIGSYFLTLIDDFGEAIGSMIAGIEYDFSRLGQMILENIGNIMMMVGMQMMKVNPAIGAGMVIGGGILQLGSGIWRGASDAGAGGPGKMKFRIEGRDIVGVSNVQRDYLNQVT